MCIPKIAKKLNRSIASIKMKLFRLGIGNTKNECTLITARQLSICLNVTPSTVHYWIKYNKLKAETKILNTKESYKLICVQDFWNWAEDNKCKLNFGKIEKNCLPPEPAWVDELRKQQYYSTKNKNRHWDKEEINSLIQYCYLGKSNKEIAELLGRTERGVYNKITRLFKNDNIS